MTRGRFGGAAARRGRRRLRPVLLTILIALASTQSAPVAASGSREAPLYSDAETLTAPEGARVQVNGTVRFVGSEPFPSLVITDEYGEDWFVHADNREVLRGFEQQNVTVEGTLNYRTLERADGVVLERRRELIGLKLVSPAPAANAR